MDRRTEGRRFRFGIRARVLGLTVLFTLLTAGIILMGSVNTLSAQLRRSTIQSAEYMVQTAADSLRQDIREVDALFNWCAFDPTVRTALLTDISASSLTHTVYPLISTRYNSMRTALYIQRFLLVTDKQKVIMLGSSTNRSLAVHAGNIDCFPGLAEGSESVQWDRIIQAPLMQPGQAEDSIPLSRTITGGGGTQASIYLSVDPDLITDALKKFEAKDGAWLCWVMGGQLYRVEGGKLVCLGDIDQLPEQKKDAGYTLDTGTQLYSAVLDDVPCSLVVCALGVHDLYLGQAIPNEQMVYKPSLLLSPALTSFAVVLLAGLVMAGLLHGVVDVPIETLQRQIQRVSQGDFTVNPAIEWNHELGDIGRGINQLSQSVSDLMSKRLEDEKQRLDLEYRMLQNQISPHFIYNTLNSIKWMASIQHAPGVAEMVTALSHLLKSVSKGNQRLVPLREEFALLEDYFTIQRYRYGGTITLSVPLLEDEALAERCLIPRFTLQPLAENAIFHGIEPKGGVGRLELTIEKDPVRGDVLLHLRDDGVGMEQEQIDRILAGPKEEENLQFRHVGVWNVHRLMQLSFGADHGLLIRSSPGEGTVVTMRLPGGS